MPNVSRPTLRAPTFSVSAMTRLALVALVSLTASDCSRNGPRVAAAPAAASPNGQWVGVASIPGSTPIRLDITLDSVAAGWRGTVGVPMQGAEPMILASVTHTTDSLTLTLPAVGQNAVLRL